MTEEAKAAPNIEAAMEFVKTQMPEGSRLAKEVKELAQANGIADRTLSRAINRLGVISKKVGFGGECVWTLPSDTE